MDLRFRKRSPNEFQCMRDEGFRRVFEPVHASVLKQWDDSTQTHPLGDQRLLS
jgi:hypothetical protein